MVHGLRGEDSNPYPLDQNQLSYRLNDPGSVVTAHRSGDGRKGPTPVALQGRVDAGPGSVAPLMGSLVKKRRKRMRKKKHKKLLRRTRHQRRK